MDPVETLMDILEALSPEEDTTAWAPDLLRELANWIDRGGATDGLAERAAELLEGFRGGEEIEGGLHFS